MTSKEYQIVKNAQVAPHLLKGGEPPGFDFAFNAAELSSGAHRGAFAKVMGGVLSRNLSSHQSRTLLRNYGWAKYGAAIKTVSVFDGLKASNENYCPTTTSQYSEPESIGSSDLSSEEHCIRAEQMQAIKEKEDGIKEHCLRALRKEIDNMIKSVRWPHVTLSMMATCIRA